ncbi:MAG: acetylxylan esterase [Cytophagales bacterium]|nr:acetylxylan esterase [Cytophagales bacterium]
MSKLFTIFLVISYVTLHSQNLLSGKWKFKTGDDMQWKNNTYADAQWSEIYAGIVFEKQGFENYDGIAWYRQSITIPSSFKSDAQKMGGLILKLAKIDDADETYFNGELIGKTGSFPPNFLNAYDQYREYTIPADKVKWDAPNLVAVRVYDGSGNGGIYGDPLSLSVKGFDDSFDISAVFPVTNHVFLSAKDVKCNIQLKNTFYIDFKGSANITVRNDFGKITYEKSIPATVKKNSTTNMPVSIPDMQPGFYQLIIDYQSPLAHKTHISTFACEPEKVLSPTDAQPDFADYWNRAKKELAAVAPQYNIIIVDSLSKGNKNMYVVEMRSLGNVLVRAWYSVPKKQGKYPALLHVQGYSSYLKLTDKYHYQSDDMIVMGLNIRGHGFSKDNINPGFPGYLQHQINDKEMYIYRGAYMDCRRALDFLFSRNEVDTTRVGVEGGSQGGALSIATAALNPERIKVCVPGVPFLSDFKDYFVVGNWPAYEFKKLVETDKASTWDKVYHTLSYIDIKNLAPWVKCPVLMGVGLKDDICPPHINFAMYNNLSVPKQYVIYPHAGHGLPDEYTNVKFEFIRQKLMK